MRIVKEINGYDFKITIMEYSGNLYAKFEKGMVEITLKFRQGHQIDNYESLQKLIEQQLTDKIPEHLDSIKAMLITALRADLKEEEDDFEEII